MRRRTGIIALSFLTMIFSLVCHVATAQSTVEPNDPDLLAILDARILAEAQIGRGELVAAGETLLNSLRVIPAERGELADAANGNMQLAVFMMEYLMPELVITQFLQDSVYVDDYESDELVRSIYFIFLGLPADEKIVYVRSLVELSMSENLSVRAMALFNLANPYFHRDEEFFSERAARLTEEFPYLELAGTTDLQLAQFYRKAGKIDVPVPLPTKKSAGTEPEWRAGLRARILEVGAQSKSGKRLDVVLRPYARGALEAKDWHERFSCVLLLEGHNEGAVVRPVAAQVARSAVTTPEVVRARILTATFAAQDIKADKGRAMSTAPYVEAVLALMNTKIEVLTPNRALWEDRMKALRASAKFLREIGLYKEASTVFNSLKAQYPNSLVSEECDRELALIPAY